MNNFATINHAMIGVDDNSILNNTSNLLVNTDNGQSEMQQLNRNPAVDPNLNIYSISNSNCENFSGINRKAETNLESAHNPTQPPQSNVIPGFILKLWKMLDDESCENFITWSDDNRSFIIIDSVQFSYTLSRYFKHNNLSSFIRQLNMYGFRKVASIDNWNRSYPRRSDYNKSNADNDRKESVNIFSNENGNEYFGVSEYDLHFYHPNFVRSQPNLLELIKRKLPQKTTGNFMSSYEGKNGKFFSVQHGSNMLDFKSLIKDIESIEYKQNSIDISLMDVRRENEMLWIELRDLQQRHQQQQSFIGNLMKFVLDSLKQQQSSSALPTSTTSSSLSKHHNHQSSQFNFFSLKRSRNQPLMIGNNSESSGGSCSDEDALSSDSVLLNRNHKRTKLSPASSQSSDTCSTVSSPEILTSTINIDEISRPQITYVEKTSVKIDLKRPSIETLDSSETIPSIDEIPINIPIVQGVQNDDLITTTTKSTSMSVNETTTENHSKRLQIGQKKDLHANIPMIDDQVINFQKVIHKLNGSKLNTPNLFTSSSNFQQLNSKNGNPRGDDICMQNFNSPDIQARDLHGGDFQNSINLNSGTSHLQQDANFSSVPLGSNLNVVSHNSMGSESASEEIISNPESQSFSANVPLLVTSPLLPSNSMSTQDFDVNKNIDSDVLPIAERNGFVCQRELVDVTLPIPSVCCQQQNHQGVAFSSLASSITSHSGLCSCVSNLHDSSLMTSPTSITMPVALNNNASMLESGNCLITDSVNTNLYDANSVQIICNDDQNQIDNSGSQIVGQAIILTANENSSNINTKHDRNAKLSRQMLHDQLNEIEDRIDLLHNNIMIHGRSVEHTDDGVNYESLDFSNLLDNLDDDIITECGVVAPIANPLENFQGIADDPM